MSILFKSKIVDGSNIGRAGVSGALTIYFSKTFTDGVYQLTGSCKNHKMVG